MTEHGGDRIQAHAPVDGLGGQGVPQPVGGDVADPGVSAEPVQCGGDALAADGAVVFDEQQIGAQPAGAMVVDPVVEKS
jgi:hypothetical protein